MISSRRRKSNFYGVCEIVALSKSVYYFLFTFRVLFSLLIVQFGRVFFALCQLWKTYFVRSQWGRLSGTESKIVEFKTKTEKVKKVKKKILLILHASSRTVVFVRFQWFIFTRRLVFDDLSLLFRRQFLCVLFSSHSAILLFRWLDHAIIITRNWLLREFFFFVVGRINRLHISCYVNRIF